MKEGPNHANQPDMFEKIDSIEGHFDGQQHQKAIGSDYAVVAPDPLSDNSSDSKKSKLIGEDFDVITKPICLAPESSPTLGPNQAPHAQQQMLIN